MKNLEIFSLLASKLESTLIYFQKRYLQIRKQEYTLTGTCKKVSADKEIRMYTVRLPKKQVLIAEFKITIMRTRCTGNKS